MSFKDKNKQKEYLKKYRKKNLEQLNKYRKKYYLKNKEKEQKQNKKYRENHKQLCLRLSYEYRKRYPWLISFYAARYRCKDASRKAYYLLKFSMSKEDFKELWFRDKAWLLDRPSIDRKYNNIGYIKSNCQFIELLENIHKK